ncbi:hypothetical protein ACFFX1_53975 [Dactylosporangium sucinum]|uniref:Uncharacterized protein n=1 Tax=Dactylosporangium sucinum TaxID=1424081 RepID=A0A917X3J7_9ACTN|nr:hypothetical protein [Dactylosporangium sucinum]GGM61174.1 hypothetical protein GCM10007977_073400 [Dactylosporangium sucinum]
MNDEAELLRPLDIKQLPPPRVDLRRAMRTGRRRERLRIVAGSGAAAVAVLATVVVVNQAAGGPVDGRPARPAAASTRPAPSSPPLGTCTFTDLVGNGVPAGAETTALDPTGRIIVTGTPDYTSFTRVVDGVPETITGVPPGGGAVVAVNRSGDFLGSSGYKPAWVYRNGKFNQVPLPGGVSSVSPVDLNDRGDALVALHGGGLDPTIRPAIWPAGQPAEVTVLEVPEGWNAQPVGLNQRGDVAGHLEQGGRKDPVVWTADGRLLHLPVPDGQENPLVTDINGDWVIARHVRWNIATGSVDRIDDMWAERVDQHGRVFGEAPNIAPPRPAVWVNGTVSLLPVDPQRPLGMMGWVSEDGTRMTSVLQADNPPNPRPVIWTCGG